MSVSISVSPVVFPELSLTSHNLSTVLDSMDDGLWEEFCRYANIPQSEVKCIKSKCSTYKECKKAAIDYLISSHSIPSWRLVANALYQMGPYSFPTMTGGLIDGDSCHRALARLQLRVPTGKCCSFWYPLDL